jgi:hypothetical protein
MPGIIPRMLGIGRAGLPTGEIFRESTVFFVITFIPQKVKYRCTSIPIAAAVVASISGGYAMSKLPLEHMMTSRFFFSLTFGFVSKTCIFHSFLLAKGTYLHLDELRIFGGPVEYE